MGQDRPLSLTRRAFLLGGAALAGTAAAAAWRRWAWLWPSQSAFEGEIVGASHALGHLLRSGGPFPTPESTRRVAVAVVGGGISGLSAGWKLLRSGLKDFEVLELEDEAGGTSRHGSGRAGAYPWGAHYLPFPGPEAKAVHELLGELGVEQGRDGHGRPVFNERMVCFAPQERLFIHGRWQEGLFPRLGASEEDLRQWKAFEARMAAFRRLRDEHGRPAFAIPMELSSRRADLLALDRLPMSRWLDDNDFTSPRVRWLVDYSCRDDFGTTLDQTSAWAGIHYFAGRGEGDQDQVLTWPEGNGWLVRKLAEPLGARVKTGALAYSVAQEADGVRVDYLDARTRKAHRLLAKSAVVCLPQFVADRIVKGRRGSEKAAAAFSYSPWVVANLTVEDPPPGHGAAPAWDNVLYRSDSLGYVDAGHQSLDRRRRESVWTWYLPLAAGDPAAARRAAQAASWKDWADRGISDLERAHRGLREKIRRLDVMVWGHAMVRPTPGFLWGGAREKAARPDGAVFYGHSDLSGFSLFEEAQYRGVKAAEGAMARLGHPFRSSL